jgi:hypothetical protein
MMLEVTDLKSSRGHAMELFISVLGKGVTAKVVGQKIEGECRDTLTRAIVLPTVPEFLNLEPTPRNILVFTQKYGPLVAKPGFSFSIREWIKFQATMRRDWYIHSDATVQFSPGVKRRAETTRTVALNGQQITFSNGHAQLVVRSLLEYLTITLDSLDPQYVKVCQNPECSHPYFIGRKKSDKLCGAAECRAWADRRDKRKSWDRHWDKDTARWIRS